MKRLFKKNQIIIATLAVMIAVAGYLNYSGKLFGDSADGTEEANADLQRTLRAMTLRWRARLGKQS